MFMDLRGSQKSHLFAGPVCSLHQKNRSCGTALRISSWLSVCRQTLNSRLIFVLSSAGMKVEEVCPEEISSSENNTSLTQQQLHEAKISWFHYLLNNINIPVNFSI